MAGGASSGGMKRTSQSSSGFSIPSRADRSRPQVKHARTAHPDLVPHLNLQSDQAIRLEERLLLAPGAVLHSPQPATSAILPKTRTEPSETRQTPQRTPPPPFFLSFSFLISVFPLRQAVHDTRPFLSSNSPSSPRLPPPLFVEPSSWLTLIFGYLRYWLDLHRVKGLDPPAAGISSQSKSDPWIVVSRSPNEG